MPAAVKNLRLISALLGGLVFALPLRAAELPSKMQLEDLLMGRQFGELERIATELRNEKTDFYQGQPLLHRFYSCLQGPGTGTNENFWTQYIDKLEKWAAADLNSVTPRIVLGNVYVAYAWKARGSSSANRVREENWLLFRDRLKKAQSYLEEADGLPTRDPELYRALMVVATGLGWSSERLEEIFKRGLRMEPNYLPLYEAKANYLMPRRYGLPGEWEAFAEEAADGHGGDEGEILYMAIARSVGAIERERLFDRTNVSYERMKQGFETVLKRTPESLWNKNSFCFFACIAGDRQTARKLFTQINGQWEPEAWRDQHYFRQWENWALHKGSRPRYGGGPGFSPEQLRTVVKMVVAVWLVVAVGVGVGIFFVVRSYRRTP